MRALPFKISITSNQSFLVQEDLQAYFYGILHTHPEIQITLILESTGTLFAGEYIGEFKPGDLYVIGSNCPHVFRNDPDYYLPDSSLTAHSISVFLGADFLIKELPELSETEDFSSFLKQAQTGLKMNADQLPGLREKMLQVKDESGLNRLILLFQIIHSLSAPKEYSVLLEKPLSREVNETDGKRLKDVIEYTLGNFTRPISIDEISDVAVMTPQSFCRFFRKSTRKTYVSFLNELRISKAIHLLKNGSLSISEVSHLAGFNNLSHFNRQFQRLKQQTPSDYRKNMI